MASSISPTTAISTGKWLKAFILGFLCAALRLIIRRPPASLEHARFLMPAYTGLGNFILKTPMIRALHQTFPEAEILVLAGNNYGTEFVLGESGVIRETLILRDNAPLGTKLAFFWQLRRRRIDVLFLPFDVQPSFLWFGALLAGIPIRVAQTWEHVDAALGKTHRMSWTRSVPTHTVPAEQGRHEIDLNYDLLDLLVPNVRRDRETFVSMAPATETLRRFGLEGQRYAVVQIGVANAGPTPRRWPAEHFLELVQRFHRAGLTVVLPGDRLEAENIHDFARKCVVPVLDLAGRTSVAEISAIISEAAVLVCHDSGLMHIGNAVRTPLVALFGSSDLPKVRPLAATSRVIFKNLPCAPCTGGFRMSEEEAFAACPIRFQCMRDISVEEVWQASGEVWRITGPKKSE